MSGREIESQTLLTVAAVDDETWAKAAARVAGRLASHHPQAAARDLAGDPVFVGDLLELLDAVGYLESPVAAARALNVRLKGVAS